MLWDSPRFQAGFVARTGSVKAVLSRPAPLGRATLGAEVMKENQSDL